MQHLTIGKGAIVYAQSGVASSIDGGKIYFGSPVEEAREKMKELWTRWVEPWFPNGLDDPDLALLEVTIDEAEFWDAPASRMQRLFGLTKALTTGDTSQLGEHAKIHPQH